MFKGCSGLFFSNILLIYFYFIFASFYLYPSFFFILKLFETNFYFISIIILQMLTNMLKNIIIITTVNIINSLSELSKTLKVFLRIHHDPKIITIKKFRIKPILCTDFVYGL